MKLRLTTRVGCAALLTWMAIAPYPPASAAAAEMRHLYEITGGLVPSSDTIAGAASTHFGVTSPRVTQAGDAFELSARLVAAPVGCAADTIFQDGFDP